MSKERKRTWEVQVTEDGHWDGHWDCWGDYPTKKEALESARDISSTQIFKKVRVVRYDASTTIEVKT